MNVPTKTAEMEYSILTLTARDFFSKIFRKFVEKVSHTRQTLDQIKIDF